MTQVDTVSRPICGSINTGLFEMIVGVLTTCHTQYPWDRSICIFLFNRTTLQDFVTYLTGVLYVHPLWFYKHQHDNRVCIAYDKLLKPWQSFRISLYFMSMKLRSFSTPPVRLQEALQ